MEDIKNRIHKVVKYLNSKDLYFSNNVEIYLDDVMVEPDEKIYDIDKLVNLKKIKMECMVAINLFYLIYCYFLDDEKVSNYVKENGFILNTTLSPISSPLLNYNSSQTSAKCLDLCYIYGSFYFQYIRYNKNIWEKTITSFQGENLIYIGGDNFIGYFRQSGDKKNDLFNVGRYEIKTRKHIKKTLYKRGLYNFYNYSKEEQEYIQKLAKCFSNKKQNILSVNILKDLVIRVEEKK